LKFIQRKQCLRPTFAGWLLIAALLGLAGSLMLVRGYDFLAPNHALGKEVLVIEGWLGDEELVQANELLHQGSYRFVITTGGPLEQGGFLSEYKTYARLSQASLQKIGVTEPVYAVPAPTVRKDRTYASALAVHDWLAAKHPQVHALDLLTAGPHARRSHMLYQLAFGEGYDIGIISLPPGSYDSSRWWKSSAGVRTVIGESIAWVYAVLLFSPDKSAAASISSP